MRDVLDAKIAAIVPCYAYPELLPETVESILVQTRPFDEVIFVLDCPNLNRREQYTDYFEKECDLVPLTTIWHKRNRGVSAARNTGVDAALRLGCDGYVSVDEDDLLNGRYLETHLAAAKTAPKVDVWYSDFAFFGDVIKYAGTREFSKEELIKGPFITGTALIKCAVWEAVKAKNGTGYDEETHRLGLRWEDYLFYLEATMLGKQFSRIGTGGLLRVRKHGESGSTLANNTQPQWRRYARAKIQQLYGEVLWPEDVGPS